MKPASATPLSRGLLNRHDLNLVVASGAIIVLTLVGFWFGVQWATNEVLRYEAEDSARGWGVFLKNELSDLPDILAGHKLSLNNKRRINAASAAGNIFRYKFFGVDGVIVHASRPEDIGETNDKTYFRDIVRQGRAFAKIEREENFGPSRNVVSEAYVPIMDGGKFIGAIEVYVDESSRAEQLNRLGNIAFYILFALMVLLSLAVGSMVVRSIFQYKRVEDDLQAARRQAERASEAKSQFLATMSHELRTPMNGVLGMASLLLAADISPQARNYAERIKHSGNLLLSLLNDILDISKIEEDGLELEEVTFSVASVTDIVRSLTESRAQEKGLSFEIEVSPTVPPALIGDPTRIRQILLNLVGNAIKFTGTGGIRVLVNARPRDEHHHELCVEVVDTGIGIEADAQEHIFDKFIQADLSTTRKFGGTGLGLTISRQLAQLMGGSIGVKSTPGNGATFWFTVRCRRGDPADAIEFQPDPVATECLVPENLRRLHVLVAEDNLVNQEVARSILEDAGLRVDMVENGLAAVEAVRTGDYDVVLMDIHMPEMDGLAATRKIREIAGDRSRIPIIALTADAMSGDREKYLAVGMNGYVSKPFEPHELFATIGRCAQPGGETIVHAEPAPIGHSSKPRVSNPVMALDPAVVEPLRTGKPDLWKRLVQIYLENAPDGLNSLESALNGADCTAVRFAAHSLKSSSANVGATRLSRLCHRLETAAKEENLDAGAAIFADIRSEFETVAAALADQNSGAGAGAAV